MTDKDRKPCVGCRDDFYNHPGPHGSKECWSLKTAKLVRRFRLHWWTAPTVPGAFTEVETYSCHSEPGQFAFYEKLPDFAVNPHKLERAS